jgi:hypothetical protein
MVFRFTCEVMALEMKSQQSTSVPDIGRCLHRHHAERLAMRKGIPTTVKMGSKTVYEKRTSILWKPQVDSPSGPDNMLPTCPSFP